MNFLEINHCPGTLAEGFSTYSRTCLNKVFQGKKVNHILPYNSPSSGMYVFKLKWTFPKRVFS